MKTYIAASAAAALLSACSLAPKYEPPRAEELSRYKEAGEWLPAHPADTQSDGPWWEQFGEPRLSELEQQLRSANPDLQAAVARLQQAREIARRARSSVYPTLNAGASAERTRTSANAPLARALDEPPSTRNDFIAGFDLSWEIDLFGRLRNTAAQAGAQARASAADLGAIELSLEAELATDFFSLRGADSTVQLLEDTVKQYDVACQHARDRYAQGVAADTDVDQAQTQLETARAQLAAVHRERATLEHAIATLVGQSPSIFTLEAASLRAAPPPLNAGLPSELLQHRPDVARAERMMAAANAGIGVARAAWFPVFTLTGALGYESVEAAQWLAAPSRYWSVGPSGQLPLLDAGGRLAMNRQAGAAYEEAVANYRKTLLIAYQEVEDSLSGLHHLGDELKADEAAAASAQSAAYHADQRYDAGVADYIEVTATHTAALQGQRDVITTRIAQLNAAVALVRATGGGWGWDRKPGPLR